MSFDLILKNVSKHILLEENEEEYFVSLLTTKELKKNEFLLRQGERCYTENFINKGCLRTYSIDDDGFEHNIMFGIEDWWAGDLFSFLTEARSNYYIDALEDTEILQITKADLEKLYERVPKFERYFRILLQNAYIAQQQRINQNISKSAEERYIDFMDQYPKLEQRFSQKQISSYLGITPVFLSMLRRKMSKK